MSSGIRSEFIGLVLNFIILLTREHWYVEGGDTINYITVGIATVGSVGCFLRIWSAGRVEKSHV